MTICYVRNNYVYATENATIIIDEHEMLQAETGQQASVNRNRQNTIEPPQISSYPSSSNTTFSSQASPATFENNFTTAENQVSCEAENIQRFFHTFT